jgi:hypothetical protein
MNQTSKTRPLGRCSAKERRYATEVKLTDITIGMRHRRDFGDLEVISASVAEAGLLQPIGATSDHVLVFAERRLRACRNVLGRDSIPARVMGLRSILAGGGRREQRADADWLRR